VETIKKKTQKKKKQRAPRPRLEKEEKTGTER
jgi:hypothetical protein